MAKIKVNLADEERRLVCDALQTEIRQRKELGKTFKRKTRERVAYLKDSKKMSKVQRRLKCFG